MGDALRESALGRQHPARERPRGDGKGARPTAFVDAPAGSEILREEVFGPVLTVQAFTDEDEAVSLANATDYGLAAILYTGDPERAERVSARLGGGDRLGELLLRA